MVACADSWGAQPAWLHDIFIDCLASRLIKRKAAASFVLDPSYAGLLDETPLCAQDKCELLLLLSRRIPAAVARHVDAFVV